LVDAIKDIYFFTLNSSLILSTIEVTLSRGGNCPPKGDGMREAEESHLKEHLQFRIS